MAEYPKHFLSCLLILLVSGCAKHRPSASETIAAGKQNEVTEMVRETAEKPEDPDTVAVVLPEPPQLVLNETVYVFVEEEPEFPGGKSALKEFLKSNIRFPELPAGQKKFGRVVVHFVVTQTGNIRDTQILYSSSPPFKEEALRVIGLMPTWKPGRQGGQPVNVRVTLPIIFENP